MANNFGKTCQFCGENVTFLAEKCPHCGEWLVKEDKSAYGIGFRNPVVITLTVLVLLILLVMIMRGYQDSIFMYYFVLVKVGLAAYIYMLPSIIAYSRKHPQFVPILFTNIFFAGTGVGWILTIMWATSHRIGRYTHW